MPLDIPAGQRCFVDANILHYAFINDAGLSPSCVAFLERIRTGEVQAVLDQRAISDALHKVLATEARMRYGLPQAGLVPWLRRHPDEVRVLRAVHDAFAILRSLPLMVLPVDWEDRAAAIDVMERTGLLTSDALIVALMRRYGIAHLATNDDDFDRVPDITIHKPR